MTKKKQSGIATDEEAYDSFLLKVELINIGLVSSSSKFVPADYVKARSRKGSVLKNSISATYTVEGLDENYFNAVGKFKLVMEDEKKLLLPVSIECSFLAHFHVESDLTKEFAERFTTTEFRVILWPYFRQFVDDLSARMDIARISVPLLADT